MKIWVDADACPVVIKEILYKAAKREHLQLILVANQYIRIPQSSLITFLRAPKGMDAADNEIADKLDSGDLVITADIPLAARVVAKGGLALNPRGEIYSEENIKERLSTRDFFDDLRASGIETGGPSGMSARDKQAFANSLDQLLRKYKNRA